MNINAKIAAQKLIYEVKIEGLLTALEVVPSAHTKALVADYTLDMIADWDCKPVGR